MEVSQYYSERFFTLRLVGVKLRIILISQKMNYLTVAIRGVGLDFGMFLNGFALKIDFSDKINE